MGNLVNWEETNWFLNSSKATAREEFMCFIEKYSSILREESLDLESDICRSRNLSFHLVPYKLKFDPETLHMCTKLSGQVTQQNCLPHKDV